VRPLLTAELLSVGSELTVGETRDTNAGDLARRLTAAGVEVLRMTALPDDLAVVTQALSEGLARADLLVSTGGLGPTPDDLTRESIAAAVGERPGVDPGLERWLRGLFERRGATFADTNLKQAWRIPSATAIPNDHGTAPGWWVDRPDGRVVVALPGPPREMVPMWDGFVLPRLEARGLGRPSAVRLLRLTGIGESLVAERLGPLLDRDADPLVATYARADAVDVRIAATGIDAAEAEARAAEMAGRVAARLEGHVWATGPASWGERIAQRLAARGERLALVEAGTRGALATLLAEPLGDRLAWSLVLPDGGLESPVDAAEAARADAGCDVGLALRVRPRRGDTVVTVAIAGAGPRRAERRLAFLGGPQGRGRAALAAAAILLERLGGLEADAAP
jgi:nicotinamide-nucleotide amidase